MNDKQRPIEERIAEMVSVGSYRDPRDGMTLSALKTDKSKIQGALGSVTQIHGQIVPMVCETYFGSTLMHDTEIVKWWDNLCHSVEKQDPATKTLSRLSCRLALREIAGIKYTSREIEGWAWTIAIHRRGLEAAKRLVGSWLDDQLHTGISAVRHTLGMSPA